MRLRIFKIIISIIFSLQIQNYNQINTSKHTHISIHNTHTLHILLCGNQLSRLFRCIAKNLPRKWTCITYVSLSAKLSRLFHQIPATQKFYQENGHALCVCARAYVYVDTHKYIIVQKAISAIPSDTKILPRKLMDMHYMCVYIYTNIIYRAISAIPSNTCYRGNSRKKMEMQ